MGNNPYDEGYPGNQKKREVLDADFWQHNPVHQELKR